MPKFKLFKLNIGNYRYVILNINHYPLFLKELNAEMTIKLYPYYKSKKNSIINVMENRWIIKWMVKIK